MRNVVDARDVEGVRKTPSRISKLLLSEGSVGARNFSMGLNITAVGSMIPDHSHDNEEEGMFIISGKGKLIVEGEEQELHPGMAIYVPPGVKHSIVNTGKEELKLVWVYAPPLPEHRRKERRNDYV